MNFYVILLHLGIDYALEYTKQDSVYYAGHSMGTTQYVVMLSQRPEYNNKVCIIKNVSSSTSHKKTLSFRLSLQDFISQRFP